MEDHSHHMENMDHMHHHQQSNMSHSVETTSEVSTKMIDHDHSHQHESMNMLHNMGHGHMFFHFGTNETVLFEFWKISDVGILLLSTFVIFVLAFCYEGLKFYREYLYRYSFQTVQLDTVAVPVENGGTMKETHKTVQFSITPAPENHYSQSITPIFVSKTDCSCSSQKTIIPSAYPAWNSNADTNFFDDQNNSWKNIAFDFQNPKSFLKRSFMVKILSWIHIWQTVLHVLQVFVSYLLMLIFMTYNVWLCAAVALGAGAGYFFFGWKKSLVVDITEHCH